MRRIGPSSREGLYGIERARRARAARRQAVEDAPTDGAIGKAKQFIERHRGPEMSVWKTSDGGQDISRRARLALLPGCERGPVIAIEESRYRFRGGFE